MFKYTGFFSAVLFLSVFPVFAQAIPTSVNTCTPGTACASKPPVSNTAVSSVNGGNTGVCITTTNDPRLQVYSVELPNQQVITATQVKDKYDRSNCAPSRLKVIMFDVNVPKIEEYQQTPADLEASKKLEAETAKAIEAEVARCKVVPCF